VLLRARWVTLRARGGVQVARRIGWMNLIAWQDPGLRYGFHLGKPGDPC
jgi:hypothetical protein